VDWDEIKERVLAGEGYTSVAKDYEVSRQAIQKRCNKEEWIANKPRSMAVKRELFKRNQKAQPNATAQPAQPVAVQPAQPMLWCGKINALQSSSYLPMECRRHTLPLSQA
jgi:hypothetical protein